ncbi:hypothetical protein C0J45_17235 [Silurus meridionalis]|nr:hypothetical protein C0J45_17235 [Silurus meridionalis]
MTGKGREVADMMERRKVDMLCVQETKWKGMALSKRQEVELEVAELKMLRFLLGVTRMDKIRNEFIRVTAHVGCFGDKVREARLRWFGHVQRRDMNYIGRRMLRMEPPGRRKRGRPRRRFMDVVREDMQMEAALLLWIEDSSKKNIPLDNNIIRKKARQLYYKIVSKGLSFFGDLTYEGHFNDSIEHQCLFQFCFQNRI